MKEYDLAKLAIEREEKAFLSFMELSKETLYRTAFAFLKDEHDAIEAVQEITVRAYKNIHTVKQPQYLKTWLVRIMINYCQDQIKKEKRFISTDSLPNIGYRQNFTNLEIEEAIATLSEKRQRLIHLKYFQDVTNKEIAELECIPEGTVKSRLHTTLQKLKKFFMEKGEIDNV